MSCVLSWCWARTVHARQRQLVVVDEAHLLLEDPSAAQLLAQLARRARKYQVALEVVTQRLADFLDHPEGRAILANTATQLLLGCEEHDRAAVSAGLHLTEAESQWLRPGRPGSGLLLTAAQRTPVRILAAPAEHSLASAGPR
jgi:type IV secretory pathway VirB4 component